MKIVLMKVVLLCITALFLMLAACSKLESDSDNEASTIPTQKQEASNDEANTMIFACAGKEHNGQKYFVPDEAVDRLIEIFYGNTMQKVEVFPESVAYYRFYYGEDSFNIDGSDGPQVCAKIDQQLYLFDLSTEELVEVNQIIKSILE